LVAGPSTIDAFNEAARRALAASNPTEALPSEYPREKAFFTFTFYYNESPLPCGLDKLRAGDLDGAIAAFSESISRNPNDKTAFLNRGIAKQRHGDVDVAIADFTQAITVDPNYSRAYADRGTAKKRLSDLTGARADFTHAIALAPSDPGPYLRRAYVEADMQDWDSALMDFRKVCELDTSSIHQKYAQLWIWLIQARLGHEEAASRELVTTSARWTTTDPQAEWVATLAQFLAGTISEGDLLQRAPSGDQKSVTEHACEAYFYAGSKRLIHGDTAMAAEYFRRTIQTGLTTFYEYDSARMELRHLGKE
jgi:lipoprotein NlpI